MKTVNKIKQWAENFNTPAKAGLNKTSHIHSYEIFKIDKAELNRNRIKIDVIFH